MKEDVLILAIESSCDETAAAVVKNGREVLSNIISSQIELHKLFGGVVPEIASRKHIEKINEVIEEAGGTKLDYSHYIKNCFDKAYDTQIVRQNDVAKMRGTKKRKATAKTAEGAPEDKSEEKPAEEAKQ